MSGKTSSGCLVALFKLFGVGRAAERQAVGEPLPYRRKDWLFTKAERTFFDVLQQAAGREHLIFAKVRVIDLVWIPKGTAKRQSHQNRVQSKHVDFVLCSRDVVRPVVAIELDDSSHDADDRRARDTFLDEVFRTAGLPLLRVPCRASYRVEEIKAQLAGAIGAT